MKNIESFKSLLSKDPTPGVKNREKTRIKLAKAYKK